MDSSQKCELELSLDKENSVTEESQTIPDAKRRKCVSVKNLVIICFAYMLYYLGFTCMSNLESTINTEGGIGVDSQATIYAVSILSAVFLPELIIKKIGTKWTYILSVAASCLYIASNFEVRWDFMMASAVINGIATGPLNTALNYYIDEMAVRYKTSDSESIESITAGFFGIFQVFTENTLIWGSLITYYALNDGSAVVDTLNQTDISFHECGVHFRPDDDNSTVNPNLTPPSDIRRYLLVGAFLACGILGAIVPAIFLDPLENDTVQIDDTQSTWKTIYDRLLASLKLMIQPHQLLLHFIALYCGLEGAFYASEFTQAFIACPLGIHAVGSVSLCFGVCGSLVALFIWPLVKRTSQLSVIIGTAVVNMILFIMLFIWNPKPGSLVLFMVFAGVWGVTDAIWWSQIPAIYGLMFPNDREAAYANFNIWNNVGAFISFSYANYLPVSVKLGIMIGVLALGVLGYLIGQYKLRYSRRSVIK